MRLYLSPVFGSVVVRDLNRNRLSETYAQWCRQSPTGRKVCARTVLHVHDLLRAALNWGRRKELVTKNVAALLTGDELPKATQPEPRALSERDLRLLLDGAKNPTRKARKYGTLSSQPWFFPAVAFAAFTGCRRGEILALRWSEVDFDAKSVVISRSFTSHLQVKPPKNGKSHAIAVSESLLKILRNHRSAQEEQKRFFNDNYLDDGLVFALANGSPIVPRHFGSAVKRLANRIGASSITLHNLRDTHASLLGKAGVPIEVLSKRLGHSNIAVTMDRYLRVYKEQDYGRRRSIREARWLAAVSLHVRRLLDSKVFSRLSK